MGTRKEGGISARTAGGEAGGAEILARRRAHTAAHARDFAREIKWNECRAARARGLLGETLSSQQASRAREAAELGRAGRLFRRRRSPTERASRILTAAGSLWAGGLGGGSGERAARGRLGGSAGTG